MSTEFKVSVDPRVVGYRPHVYEPLPAFNEAGRPRFMVAVPWDLLPEEARAVLRKRPDKDFVSASSMARPEVDVDWRYALGRLDEMRARNLPADRWLMEHRLELTLDLVDLPDYVREKYGYTHSLVLRGVKVMEALA
jgi:hypothetical protein